MSGIYDVIVSYNEYIKKLPEGCQTIAKMLKENRSDQAMQNITNFSEGIVWLEQASSLFERNDIICHLNLQQIHPLLEQVNEGLEKSDFLQVAHIFEQHIAAFFVNIETINQFSN